MLARLKAVLMVVRLDRAPPLLGPRLPRTLLQGRKLQQSPSSLSAPCCTVSSRLLRLFWSQCHVLSHFVAHCRPAMLLLQPVCSLGSSSPATAPWELALTCQSVELRKMRRCSRYACHCLSLLVTVYHWLSLVVTGCHWLLLLPKYCAMKWHARC